MNELVKYIFLFLISTTVINFMIAVAARVKTQSKEFNQLILYWTSLFLTYFAVASLGATSKEIAFAYFFQFMPSFFMSKMLMNSRQIEFNLKFYGSMQFVGASISAYLILFSDVGFTLSLIPVTFTTSLPMWSPMWNTLITHRLESNWIEKGMGIMFFTGIINHFNYAFFRLDESAAWWGWSVSIAQYQCLSIFLPLLINHRRAQKERNNLELALEKISGKYTGHNVEIDELYRTLELQISQKDELSRKLTILNLNLEEERETNEMLIKTVSHDLANPLTVITAYIDMLQAGRIPEDDKIMIWDRIKLNTKSALEMISRIRDAIVTRNQASMVTIHDVSIHSSVTRLLDQFDGRLKAKNIKIIYENNAPLDLFVEAEDNTLTEHVFSNVLSNAIKFSFESSEIKIKVTEVENDIQIEFKDFGIGIDPERLKKRLLHSTNGTKGETGSGFGVMVMGYFLRKFGATHLIHSEGAGLGTSVSISLKKSSKKTFKYVSEKKIAQFSS